MDVQLINPFIEATALVFDTMLNMSPTTGGTVVLRKLPPMSDTVSASVEMSGGASGALLLVFPRGFVLQVARVLDGCATTIDDGMDAIGELSNMITGAAKRKLSGELVTISIPAVHLGMPTQGAVLNLTPWLNIPFRSALSAFDLFVSIQSVKSSPAARRQVQAASP
jgi:chemotaxis protein CheX